MALSIASAFRLRNKLKEKIKRLTDQTALAEASKPVGTAENTAVFDGKTFRETIGEVGRLMAVLRDFNIAVDKANSVNKVDLITLETVKSETAFYENIVRQLRRVEKYSYEFNAEGGRDKIELEPVLDQRIILERLDELKKQKDALEDKLADSNFKTQVDFDQDSVNKLL